MATQIYLSIDFGDGNVAGTAVSENYAGQIELKSFDWALKAPESVRTGTAQGPQRPHLAEATLVKDFDLASPALLDAMKSGKQFTSALITVEDQLIVASDSSDASSYNPVLALYLTNGWIEDVSHSLNTSETSVDLEETIKLAYGQVQLTYYQPDDDGLRSRNNYAQFSSSAGGGGSSGS